MSHLVDHTLVVELAVRNPFTGKVFPSNGTVFAVVDTGYEGFLLIPGDVFEKLFGELESEKRELILADGRKLISRGVYGEVLLGRKVLEGFVETIEGLDEFVTGIDLLKSFRIEVDYCLKSVRLKVCR
jgi:clan AA aspartic protease